MSDGAQWLESAQDGVVISVKAAPRSSKAGIDGRYGTEALKVRIKSAPVDGKANKELVAVVADALGIAKSQVGIVSGPASKHKRILARGITAAQALACLAPQ